MKNFTHGKTFQLTKNIKNKFQLIDIGIIYLEDGSLYLSMLTHANRIGLPHYHLKTSIDGIILTVNSSTAVSAPQLYQPTIESMNACPYLAVILLAGCSTVAGKTTDNRQWTSVSCSTYMQFNQCQDEALQVCPNGYDVANITYSRGEQLRRMDVACKP